MIRAAILPGLIAVAASLPLAVHAAEPGSRRASVDFGTCAKPEWPRKALRDEEEGTVTLGFLVGRDGKVKYGEVVVSSGSRLLDEAAFVGIKRCAFSPAIRDGEPVESWMQIPYRFTLADDIPGATPALSDAANRGDPAAQLEMARRAASPQDAALWYRKAADQGVAAAQYQLGVMHSRGKGVPQDTAEAAAWFRKAASNRHAWGQLRLGEALASGRGVVRNDAEANEWLLKAAEQGLVQAQSKLGYRLAEGIGAARDDAAAVGWFRKAVDQRDPFAQNNLGYHYATGAGVPRDYAEARRLYRMAAANGIVSAEEALGDLYETGRGVEADLPTALKWYRGAAAKNNAPALRKLGMLYEAGRGVEKNPATALSYFQRAGDAGDRAAMQRLAAAYTSGELGVAPDPELAKRWKERAERVNDPVDEDAPC